MNQPTLRPAVVPGRPRLTGFRAACLALLSWCALPAALVHAAPIAPTTIGFDSISGAIGNYYNGGEGPNVGIESTFPAVGGWLYDQTNPTLNVPSGFTTGFAVVWNVRDGMRIRIFDGLDGSGTQLATQDFFGISGTASLPFSGTARSVRLERFGQPDFLGYDNLTFGSTTVGTPVSEPPAVTTSAATGVTSATATLNATINPAGSATTAQFEYGTTLSYGSTASVTLSPNNGTTAQTVSANLSGLAASTTYYYRATAVNGVGPRNGSGLTFTTAAPPAKALHFDGANDSVNIDSARSQVSGASKLTIEMWVKPGALSGQPVLWSGSGVNYIQTDTSHNLFLIFNGVGQVRWNKSSFFTPGVWQHVAMVFDGSLPDASRWRVYKDGALVTPTSAGGMPATIPSLSGQMLLGQYSGGGFNFPGAMDEVRIWNSARTQAEIQAFKDTEIASMPSCLIAYYKFNQGLANGANAGITTLTDIANATAENGTLNNFALTGATSNWTDGSGIAETASAYAPGVPDINLKGGSPLVTILDGTTTTGTASGTDFGSSLVGTGVARTFTLENTGTSALTVSALSFSGANAGDYAVSGITLPATVAANANTTFTVTFTPSAGGARTATVNVVNDDCDESNYDFALTGTGTVNNPPTVVAANGTVTVNEGSTAFNGISFSDPEGNSVTLTASLGTVSAGGGTSAFAGSDLTTAGRWRTASVVKPSDPDGDNVYGTDGYAMWGLNGVETVVNPAYATITKNPSLSLYPGDPNYKTIDDPANPSGPQKVTGVLYNHPGGAVPTVFYTLTFTQARRVRMGILVDNSNVPAVSPATLRLRQTAGGTYDSGHVAAGDGTSRNQTVDYYFFDIAAQAGDVFEISGINDVGFISNGIGGMFLDTAGWTYATLDGPAGPTTVTITATDSLGASGQTTFTLNVNNVAPTATFSRSAATANENTVTPPSVSFTGQTDPGTTDVSTGFKYSYDYNNDGTWDDGDGTYAGSLTAATKTIPASYFASPAPASLTVKGRILDKDGGLTDYTVSITINHAPTAINGPLTIVEDFDYGASAGTLSGNGGAGFSTAWNGGSYTPTGLTFSSLTSPGGAWNGGSGSRNFAASLAAAGPITGDFLFSMSSAPPGRVQMFGLGGFNNQGYTIALAPANDSTPTGGVPIVGLNSGGFANVTAGAVALNTTYLYRFAYAGSSITVWILSAAQYDNFAPGGLTDAELNAATVGTGATQVTGRVTRTGNVTANMANLFTYTFGGGGVTMDRLRMTGQPVGASLVVAENAAINTSVGTLTPSDADSGNMFTFALVNGAGDTDNASFNINGSTLRSSAVFNHEVKNSYSIRVRVTDQGGLSYETPLTVTIINVNEAVTDVALSPSSIAENNAANATVGTLSATDGDTGDTHTFTLVGGAGSGDNGSFTIAANALKLTPSADFETKPTYALRVRATDAGGLFFEKALTVTITDVAENVAPTVARDAATVTVPEGTTAFNSGTFADANSDTVTITASVGTITQSGAGAWTHQQTLTQGGNPIELVLDSQENLYVVNPSLNTLYKYNSSGGLVTSWTVTGAPTGVAVDSANGWLYVVLKDGRRVDKFTLSGTLLTSWGSLGSGDGQFSGPHCVAVDAAGDVYVADSGNNRIQVFSPTGTFLRKWGSTGSGNGQFSFPQGLRISPGGTLYIADRNNNRVQYFNTAGTFLGKWGSGGSGDGQFNGPAGIGIDPAGNVVVGDHGNNRIQRFTATGTFVDKLGPSTAAGNLSLPHGTAFPPSGRSVYIADFMNGRVVKFATPGGWNWSFTPADGAAGPTTVTITATDNGSPNLSSTTTFTLNVNNVAPTIALTGNPTVPNGTPYTLNLGAITDPGTDTVSAFSINWGDGNTENFTGNPASTTKTHTYATLGAKTITVTLTDEDGTVTGGTRSVTVVNAAPVAGADGLNRPNTTTVAKVLKSVLLGNDSDADSDPLTLTAVGNAQPAGATVTLAGNFVVYTAPANNAGNGSFTYTLSAGAHSVTGTVTVTETSTSGGGGGTPNYLTLVPSGNDFVVTFLGVPGGSFRVQYSTSTAPPYVWTEFAPQAIYTAAPNGVFTHTDVNPPGPVRFYRAVSNP